MRCISVSVWSLWRALRFLCWCWEEEDTQSGTLLAAGKSDWLTGCQEYQDSVVWPVLSPCFRTFETSLLLEESISDELPYSGEFTWWHISISVFTCDLSYSITALWWSYQLSVCVFCRVFWIFRARLHTASWRQHQDRKPELQTGFRT